MIQQTNYVVYENGGIKEIITDLLTYQDWDISCSTGLSIFISSHKMYFAHTSGYSENSRGVGIYRIPIPNSARKIRYTLVQQSLNASDPTQDMFKFCIGIKRNGDDTLATPEDEDYIVKQTQEYVGQSTIIESELNLDGVYTDSYLYVMSNGYSCYLTKLEMVEGGADLNDLSDIDISSPTDGQSLIYNGNSQKWENTFGGGETPLIVTVTTDDYLPIDNSLITGEADKTYSEIKEAIASGRIVYCSLYCTKFAEGEELVNEYIAFTDILNSHDEGYIVQTRLGFIGSVYGIGFEEIEGQTYVSIGLKQYM